jgi:hypothetical protein
MNRRRFIAGLGALILSPSAFSDEVTRKDANQDAEVKPYKEVKLNYEDKGNVLLAMSFSCSHCKVYDGILTSWSKSLPTEYLSFDRLPIVIDKESAIAATAYYAFSKAVNGDAEAKSGFASRAFELIQTQGRSMSDPETWLAAAEGVFLPTHLVKNEVVKAAEKVFRYNLERTPTVIFGGRYVATPNDAGGREDLFLQLANGLASMALIDLGYRPKT